MRSSIILAIALASPVARGSGADEKQPKVPKDLQGTWKVTGAVAGKHAVTSSGGVATVVIGEDSGSWGEVGTETLTWLKEGKGTIKVDAAAEPPTIELKSGEVVYRGIYRFGEFGGAKKGMTNPDLLVILFSKAGGEFPKAFGPTLYELPKDFEGFLLEVRRKK